MRETRVRSLRWEDPLEKEMVTHTSILAWRIPWTEEPGRLQSTGGTHSRTRLSDFTFTFTTLKRYNEDSKVTSPWMASSTRWSWVWANSGRWWWTGKPGVLQSMGLQSLTRLSDWTEGLKFSVWNKAGSQIQNAQLWFKALRCFERLKLSVFTFCSQIWVGRLSQRFLS